MSQDDVVNQSNDAFESTHEVLSNMFPCPEDLNLVEVATSDIPVKEMSNNQKTPPVIPSPNLQSRLSTNETRKNNNKFNTTTDAVVVNLIESADKACDGTLPTTLTQIQQYQTQIQALNAQLRKSLSRDAKWALFTSSWLC